jgi:hypothetical protein
MKRSRVRFSQAAQRFSGPSRFLGEGQSRIRIRHVEDGDPCRSQSRPAAAGKDPEDWKRGHRESDPYLTGGGSTCARCARNGCCRGGRRRRSPALSRSTSVGCVRLLPRVRIDGMVVSGLRGPSCCPRPHRSGHRGRVVEQRLDRSVARCLGVLVGAVGAAPLGGSARSIDRHPSICDGRCADRSRGVYGHEEYILGKLAGAGLTTVAAGMKQRVGSQMAMQVFSLIAILGALIVLIPTALRVFGKSDNVKAPDDAEE